MNGGRGRRENFDPGATVVIAGSGGLIGSHLVDDLARMREIVRLVLVDGDAYESHNIEGQLIDWSMICRPKVEAQAERIRRINPTVAVETWAMPLAEVPLGRLRADVIVSCLDSRRPRLELNRRALALGIRLVDTGVDGPGRQWQVGVFDPRDGGPCLACGWDDRDHALVEQVSSCSADRGPAPTNAPAALGAMVGGYAALRIRRLLGLDVAEGRVAGLQHRMMAADGVLRTVRHVRAAGCRADHAPLSIERLEAGPTELTPAEALALGGGAVGGVPVLQVFDRSFHVRLGCIDCGRGEPAVGLYAEHAPPTGVCPHCGGMTFASGADLREELHAGLLDETALARPLADLGLRPGEVIRVVHGDRERWYELSGEAAVRRPLAATGGVA